MEDTCLILVFSCEPQGQSQRLRSPSELTSLMLFMELSGRIVSPLLR